MFVIFVIALDVGDGVRTAKAGESIHMAVGIVTGQVTVMKPKYPFGTKVFFQFSLDFFLRQVIPVFGKQAFSGGQNGSLSVAFDAAAFEHKVQPVLVLYIIGKNVFLKKLTGNLVIQISRKFHSPAVERKIKHYRFCVFHHSNAPVIACPGIVGGNFHVRYFVLRQIPELLTNRIFISTNDQQFFTLHNFACNTDETLRNLIEHIGPVGAGMRPGEVNE